MFAGQLENEEETMAKPLTPKEYQHWKDTSLIEEDTIDRFAATLDFLFANNTRYLELLEQTLLGLDAAEKWLDSARHHNAANTIKAGASAVRKAIKEAENKQ